MVSEQLTVYRGCTPVVDTRFERPGDGTLTEELVGAVAAAEGVDPLDLPSLYETVDLEALSQLFERSAGAAGTESIFGFTYRDWNVFVHSNGRIRVCDGTKSTDPELVFEGKLD